jgi:hypothetical protein
MQKESVNGAGVATPAAQERDTVVIALIIIGNIRNSQVVSFLLRLRRLTTDPWNTSWKSGLRNWVRN